MYYYNSAYTTYNYAAGALGILVVAVVLTSLLLVLVLLINLAARLAKTKLKQKQ